MSEMWLLSGSGEGTICEDCQKAQKKDVKIYVEPVHIPVKNPRQQ